MKYCRYCAFCISGDAYYCTSKEKELSRWQVYRGIKCGDFVLSELGCIETGKQYKPQKDKTKSVTQRNQIDFEEAEKTLDRTENHE